MALTEFQQRWVAALADMNDMGQSFSKIADYIEKILSQDG